MLAPKVYKDRFNETIITFAAEAFVTGKPDIELYTNLEVSRRNELISLRINQPDY